MKKGYLLVILSGILWGTLGYFTTRLGQYGLSNPMIAFLRIALGAVFIGIAVLIMKGPSVFRIDRRGFLWCILLGLFPQALYNATYTKAMREAGMAAGAVLLYTAPVFVCIMSRIFFKERLTKQKTIALAVNLIGCMVAVTGGSLAGLQIPVSGLISGLAAGFFYGTLTIISTAALKEYDSMTVLFYGMTIGAILLGLMAGPQNIAQLSLQPGMLWMTAGLALIPTCMAYLIYMTALSSDNLEPSRVPVAASIEIVSASFFGTALLHQGFSIGKGIGIVIILLSIIMMNHGTEKQ